MTTARDYVAKAIQQDEDMGGQGILTDDEIKALEWAGTHDFKNDASTFHRQTLMAMLAQLGHGRMFISGAGQTRVDAYYLRCADLAIGKYEEWLDQRAKQRATAGDA